jgi:cation transport regulator ChaC
MLHFAYGANMDRAVMHRHAPAATPVGEAVLHDHRFLITSDGYASVEPARAAKVHGVLWRLTARDRIMLDRWESTASGQYRTAMMSVQAAGGRRPALVYVARPRSRGVPKAGYMNLVVAAARSWHLPLRYIASLERWLPTQQRAAGTRNLKEFGWT